LTTRDNSKEMCDFSLSTADSHSHRACHVHEKIEMNLILVCFALNSIFDGNSWSDELAQLDNALEAMRVGLASRNVVSDS
jgi:hypothetical protein